MSGINGHFYHGYSYDVRATSTDVGKIRAHLFLAIVLKLELLHIITTDVGNKWSFVSGYSYDASTTTYHLD